jgi:hypothetical protein
MTSGFDDLDDVQNMFDYESVTLRPELESWPISLQRLTVERLNDLRRQARQRLVAAAVRYSETLRQSAERIDSADKSDRGGLPKLLSGDPQTQPILMTGHQPVVFHSGLTFKYELSQSIAEQQRAIGVAVIIDTDELDAGEFPFPDVAEYSSLSDGRTLSTGWDGPPVVTRQASFGRSSGLASLGRVKPVEEFPELLADVTRGLVAVECSEAGRGLREFTRRVSTLPTTSMMEANLLLRWEAGIGDRLAELPLSQICRFPEVLQLFAGVLSQPFEFAACYNSTLTAYREEHRIRNDVNPFPSLRESAELSELPFWVVSFQSGTRRILQVRRSVNGRQLLTEDEVLMDLVPGQEAEAIFALLIGDRQLVPRGALITAMLRLLFSDLFVHGTGGGRYDQYTDQLIRSWWQVEPTPFAVASASRYLFADQRREILRLQAMADQLRDLQYNPQRHLGKGFFRRSDEVMIQQLVDDKVKAVTQLKEARQAGQPADQIGREIQRLSDSLRATVAAQVEPQMATLKALSEDSLATFRNRQWPWFFFSKYFESQPAGMQTGSS